MIAYTFLPALALACTAAAKPPSSWKVGAKWQFEIQDPVKVPADINIKLKPDADVWDIDLWHALSNKTIAKSLHDRGKTVICYFNFGAVQPEDCDFKKWIEGGLWNGPWYGDVNPGSDNKYCERYQNITNPKVVQYLKGRLDDAVSAGCDGVDPDNIDLYNGLDVSEDQVVSVMKEMADYAHSKGLMIGQKNAKEISAKLVDSFDFAVLEGCLTGDGDKPFCNTFTNYLKQGKPVVDIEYPESLGDSSDKKFGCRKSGYDRADSPELCTSDKKNKTPAGMSEVLKLNFDAFGLNACTQYCSDSGSTITDVIPENERNACSYDFTGKCTAEYHKNLCC